MRSTAFYQSVPSSDPNCHYIYLVTAQHNLNEAVRYSTDGKVLIRPNWLEVGEKDPSRRHGASAPDLRFRTLRGYLVWCEVPASVCTQSPVVVGKCNSHTTSRPSSSR